MSEDREPIDTSTPWHRPRKEPLSLVEARVEYERKAYRAMTDPGGGRIHPNSVTTPTYEANRPMASKLDSRSIIKKKGVRPTDIHRPLDKWDKTVIGIIIGIIVLIVVVTVALFIKLG